MKTLEEAILFFQDEEDRERYVSVIEAAHCHASASLISEFADELGRIFARALKKQGVSLGTVLAVCDDLQFGLDIGNVLLGSFKIGVAVGIEMEKQQP